MLIFPKALVEVSVRRLSLCPLCPRVPAFPRSRQWGFPSTRKTESIGCLGRGHTPCRPAGLKSFVTFDKYEAQAMRNVFLGHCASHFTLVCFRIRQWLWIIGGKGKGQLLINVAELISKTWGSSWHLYFICLWNRCLSYKNYNFFSGCGKNMPNKPLKVDGWLSVCFVSSRYTLSEGTSHFRGGQVSPGIKAHFLSFFFF